MAQSVECGRRESQRNQDGPRYGDGHRPRPGKEEPEESIAVPKFRPTLLSTEDGELLAEGEILQREIRAQPAGGIHKGHQPQEGRDHDWKCRLLSAVKSKESTRPGFWRRSPPHPLSASSAT